MLYRKGEEINMKKLIISSLIFIILGAIIFVGGLAMLKWDFKSLSILKYDTHAYEPQGDFTEIFVDTSTAHINFVVSDNGKAIVVSYEKEKANHLVNVENGVLTIKMNDTRKWYHRIEIDFDTAEITVALPKDEYESLKINAGPGKAKIANALTFNSADINLSTGDIYYSCESSGDVKLSATTGDISVKGSAYNSLCMDVTTGDIEIYGINCTEDITLDFSTGEIEMKNVTCKRFFAKGTTGDIEMENVIGSDLFSLETNTGDIELIGCDAAELNLKATTGDIYGSLLSEKIFITDTSTGKVDTPRGTSGGICQITTTTGNIKMTVEK